MCVQGLVGKPGGRKNHLEDRSVDGRIILKRVFKNWDGEDMNWIGLVQDGGRWRALVNAVMKFRGP